MNKKSFAPRFLYTFCIGYAGSLIIDPTGNLLPYLSMGMIILGIIFGLNSTAGKSSAGIILVITLIFPLAAINAVISSNPTDSSLKWLLWLATLFGMYLMAQRSGSSVDEDLCKKTAPAFFIIWLFLAIKGNVLAETGKEKSATLHLSAFYANLLISSAIFIPKKFYRIVFVLIGTAGALTSGSRAAFLFLPMVFIPGVIYYYKVKFSSIAAVGLVVGLLFLILQNESLNALTFGRKGAEITSLDSMELAERSSSGRAELRQLGVEYISQKPWGYGYGQSFEVVIDGKSLGNNLHNGYLNVATQMGFHIFLIYITFIFWIYYKLTTNITVSRRARYFTLSILSCVFLRAVSESFSLFDLGHPAAFFSLFLISLFVTRLRNPQQSI
jgi:hypothetical protein